VRFLYYVLHGQAAYYDQLLGLEPPSNSNSSLQEQRVAEFSMAKHYQLTADEQAIVQVWCLQAPQHLQTCLT